jgi:hypothetical protein
MRTSLTYPFRCTEPVCTLPSEMTHELCRRFCGSRSAAKPGGFAESGQDPARAWRAGIHRVCRQRRQAKLTSLPQTVMLKWRGRGVPVDRLRLAWNGERINQRVTAAPPRRHDGSEVFAVRRQADAGAASRRSSLCNVGLIPTLTAHRPGATRAGQPRRAPKIRIILVPLPCGCPGSPGLVAGSHVGQLGNGVHVAGRA